MLQEIDNRVQRLSTAPQADDRVGEVVATPSKLPLTTILKENFKDFNFDSFHKPFLGRTMARHSSVIFLIWLTIGVAYPLYFAFIPSYLEQNDGYSTNTSFDYTYMVYCVVSSVGIVGLVAGELLVETRFGRRWMMAISSLLTGAFLFSFTPESFLGRGQGTGTGIAATLLRLGGLAASSVSTYGGYTAVPIYASTALWMLVGLLC